MNDDLLRLTQILGVISGTDDWFFDQNTKERKIELLSIYKEDLEKMNFSDLKERLEKGLNKMLYIYQNDIKDINPQDWDPDEVDCFVPIGE